MAQVPYSHVLAPVRIYIEGALAFAVGDPVPEETADRLGLLDPPWALTVYPANIDDSEDRPIFDEGELLSIVTAAVEEAITGGLSARVDALEAADERFYARSYGTIVTGSTVSAVMEANTLAIEAAVTAATATGGVVIAPLGTVYIRRSIWLPSNVVIDGQIRGAATLKKPASVKSLLTADASVAATSVTVADATGFTVGGGIHIYDTSNFEGWTSTNAVITGVAGNVITFARHGGGGLRGSMQTARAATATTSFPLIRNETASVNIGVRNLTLDQNKNANDPPLAYADFTAATISLEESYSGRFYNIALLNACGDAYSDQSWDGAVAPTLDGTNNKKTKNRITESTITGSVRHGVHLGTGMDGAFVLDNDINNCAGYGVFYCAWVTNTIVARNIIDSCGFGLAGIDDRDFGNIIANNQINNSTSYAIEAGTANAGAPAARVGRLSITGNKITGKGIITGIPDCTVTANTFDLDDVTGAICIEVNGTADRSVIEGNVGRNGGSGSYGLYLKGGADDLRIVDNDFSDMAQGATVGWSTGLARLVAIGNHFSNMTTNIAWNFEGVASTDCVIRDEMCTLSTPLAGDSACVRLVYEGIGTNGANNPASAGDWNAATGVRHNGRLVRWNSGGGEKVSVYYQGVGWTVLN